MASRVTCHGVPKRQPLPCEPLVSQFGIIVWGRRLPAKNAAVHPFSFEHLLRLLLLYFSSLRVRLASNISLRGVAVGLLFFASISRGCPGSPFRCHCRIHIVETCCSPSDASPFPSLAYLDEHPASSAVDLHIPSTPLALFLSTLVPALSLFLPFHYCQPHIASPCQHTAWPCSKWTSQCRPCNSNHVNIPRRWESPALLASPRPIGGNLSSGPPPRLAICAELPGGHQGIYGGVAGAIAPPKVCDPSLPRWLLFAYTQTVAGTRRLVALSTSRSR